jgi:hypothetical protein
MKKYAPLLMTIAVAITIIGVMLTCVKRKDTGMINERSRSVEQVFDAHRDSLLSIPGVVGAGIAQLDEKPCIMVMVKRKSEVAAGQIPQELDGYKVIIEEAGQSKGPGQ